jgi:hypothetical protein
MVHQLGGVPPICLHSVSCFDRHQGRRHHFALHPQGRQLPVQSISRWTRLVAGLQLFCRSQLLCQFPNRLFSIRNDPNERTSPSGSAMATAIVSAWTSKLKNRTFFMEPVPFRLWLCIGSYTTHNVTHAQYIGTGSLHID